MELNDRIKRVREKFCNDSNKEFAEKLGFKPQYASNITKHGKNVGKETLNKILEIFPEVNPVWLKMGEGEMLKEDMASNLHDQRINKDYEGIDAKELMTALHNFSEAAKLNAIANDKNADARLLEAQNTKELICLITEKKELINKQAKTG
ncbi:MAG: helix-turn-helix transcriptional regulator [Mangrovibacterium sp.]